MLPFKPSGSEPIEAPRWRVGIDRRRVGVYVVLALVAGFVCGYASARYAPHDSADPAPAIAPGIMPDMTPAAAAPSDDGTLTGRVVRVLRGDLIEVENVGAVRLLGVETPDGRPQYGEHGKQALAFVEQALAGQEVRLEFDPAGAARQHRNAAGETLAYVFTGDGRLLNAEVLKQGHGFVKAGEPFAREESFRACEREAMQAMRGLWGLSAAGGEAAGAAKTERQRLAPLDPAAIGPNLPALASSTPGASPAGEAVYVAPDDRIYHKAGCAELGKRRQAMGLSEARQRGYSACGRCFASTVLKAK